METLRQLDLLVKQPIFAAREVSKIHEEFKWGTAAELIEAFKTPKGEFTLIVSQLNPTKGQAEAKTDGEIVELFGQLTELKRSGSKRDAARVLAERLGMTPKQVYNALERHKLGR